MFLFRDIEIAGPSLGKPSLTGSQGLFHNEDALSDN